MALAVRKKPKLPGSSDIIRVNRTSKKIRGTLTKIIYRDKDTRQIVMYLPSFDLSGYGENELKAEEMLKFCLNEYLGFLIELSPSKMDVELGKLGWKHNRLKNKEYSSAYIDIKGELQNFNAVGDRVEVGLLTV